MLAMPLLNLTTIRSAHGQHFHTSIWYVALNGIKDESYVERAYNEYEEVNILKYPRIIVTHHL